VATHPALCDVGDQARRAERSEWGHSEASSPISRVGWLPFATVVQFSYSCAREEAISAREGF
jgi:hypothetical protein